MDEKIFKKVVRLMGNRFDISAVGNDESRANHIIDYGILEIQRIEKLLTTFNDSSQTQQINDLAGIDAVKVDQEVFDLIARSIRISDLTQGAFDLSYGSVDKSLWNFDVGMKSLPSSEVAKAMVRLINYKNILLDPEKRTVFLKEKGMRIGFGGIGKGYAAEMAKAVMIKNGALSGVVNASGDLTTWGKQPGGLEWTIGIADPDSKDQPFSYMKISDMAVATSGNYEKFVMINGRKYSHTINPKTGLPVTGIKSVTIISPNAELSDALATPVTVLGVKVGLDLINQMKQIACIIIDDHNKIFTSKNIKIT
ncbi:FAD:protein FMN transferase [Dyadobacter frigoris]|uniref:FAD:protein FMN transferase n=1 Tax=Dyadobacter frigoris TaxID=2576211 RepID=A0A4U6D2C2_9BACT|nr:FAD:protein FMN transferase [Dyadobacter frigoris]TKT88004.1 FAD:protein FMN transferase [Dyadobacter frigoris]GLU52902.1 FAD:protein FMN transferase [Dyadobacter frigoris]